MIDKWFVDDVEKVLSQHNRLVITDTQGEGRFLLEFLPKTTVLMEVAKDDLSEIEARYVAAQKYAENPVVFYTTKNRQELNFLMEYAETNGCVDLDDMEQYIKSHLFADTHENTELDKQGLLMAAKLSKGKDLNWWKGVCRGIIKPLDSEEWLMQLLLHPSETKEKMDEDIWNVFAAEIYEWIGKPQTAQPAEVMAQTVMDEIFKGLIQNNIPPQLLSIYYRCTDSAAMRAKMVQYISGFSIPNDVSPLTVHPDHPFAELDKKLFKMLSKALEEGAFISQYLHVLCSRTDSKKASDYKASWLIDIKTLMEHKSSDLHSVNSLGAFAAYYQTEFSRIDSAIRHLYAEWLHDEQLLRPYQYHYEQQNKVLLEKWFELTDHYTPTQRDILKEEFNDDHQTAVIICDGLRLEIAECIATQIDGKKNARTALAMLPSVTENGMSALFGCPSVEIDTTKRYQQLREQVKDVQILPLDKLNNGVTAQKLVLLFGDIDQVGEKKQLSALKDINAYEHLLTEKIRELLSMGYSKVVLTSDHGFVITGILDEADKVVPPNGVDKVEERFCTSLQPLVTSNMVERQSAFRDSNFQYYAKTDKPFRTKGAYGYAHGGFTPQECIIPVYEFLADTPQDCLAVSISNKETLKNITGNHFVIKLKAEDNTGTLFHQEREIQLLLFENGKQQTATPIFKMAANETQEFKYELPSLKQAKAVIIDANSKKQIDFCIIEKNDARGLDDLL